MRPNYIPLIILGVLLLYVGIFGIEGLGLQWTGSTLPTTEEFNDTNGWSPYEEGLAPRVIINPAGQAEFNSVGSTLPSRDALTSSPPCLAVQGVATFTVSFRMQINAFGETTGTNLGAIGFGWYDMSWWWWIEIRGTGEIKYSNGVSPTPGTASWSADANWHTWTFLNTRTGTTGDSVDFYLDAQKLGTLQSAGPYALTPKLSLDCFNNMVVHIDWIKVVSGLVNPSQPTTGTLTVSTTKDGGALSGVSVSISGPTPKSGTTVDGQISWSDLSPGSYSVSGTYNSVSKQGVPSPVSVSAGGSATSSMDFTSTTPGTGTIIVTCQDVYGNALSGIEVSITRSGGPTTKQTTSASGVATFINLQYSSYTISATFNDETKTDAKTISSSSPTAASTLQFSSEKPEPNWWDIFVLNLRSFVNKLRTPMQVLGGIITAIGAIMLILPAKNNTIRIAAPRTA